MIKRLLLKYSDEELGNRQAVGILLLLFVLGGVIGWVWEFLIKFSSGGFNGVYVTGGNLLPWINMYAYGTILILIIVQNLKKKPFLVFLASAVSMGVFELLGGWLIYLIGNGTRYWDYTNEWYGFGNINGFVCPASVIAFGLGALALVYGLVPFCIKLTRKMTSKAFFRFAVSFFAVILIDDIVNLALRWTGNPSAMDLYSSLGFKM